MDCDSALTSDVQRPFLRLVLSLQQVLWPDLGLESMGSPPRQALCVGKNQTRSLLVLHTLHGSPNECSQNVWAVLMLTPCLCPSPLEYLEYHSGTRKLVSRALSSPMVKMAE
ncbi:hypothetical protein PoB_002138400 [Plakobranchus ocellatus]|uniref:Uncharacterized protein n=1 Tax=Plakobranchus ocellatus TaxID=259542 RepID=A0AAV3ZKH8_9GAST|nr:hypothetical protein PoB_002138400 [Plakobranchus ocellatus]